MYIFSERGDQELSKTVSIMFIQHHWTILQYLEVLGVFSGIKYSGEIIPELTRGNFQCKEDSRDFPISNFFEQ